MNFQLPQATTAGAEVDQLIYALILGSCAILTLVYGSIAFYIIRYRVGSAVERGIASEKTWKLEVAWTSATLLVFFGLFVWGADLYVRLFVPPSDALKIYVVAKQWMWKVEHNGGQREINALHVPIGRPIQLVMTSEDVIHDFSVPAFRVKHDVLPGRYEMLWFEARLIGTFRLFCTQLCGTEHAQMIGDVVTMSAPDYQLWLAQNDSGASITQQGATLFRQYGCSGCHGSNGAGGLQTDGEARAPSLAGLYGSLVPLADGVIVTADDAYIRDSILMPQKQIVAGYSPIMPSFAGQISEEDLLKLIAYVKSLTQENLP